MRNDPRNGSILLLALGLALVASVTAYGFLSSMRSASTVSSAQMPRQLAQSAARMGARHAVEVIMRDRRDRAAASVATYVEDPHSSYFRHHDYYTTANQYPAGTVGGPYEGNVDNVSHESRQYLAFHQWYGGQGTGEAYSSEGGSWPFGTVRRGSIILPGNPRWIEPFYYNQNMQANPVRFGVVPGSTPTMASPIYYDENWQSVASRAAARYRLRYAVSSVDLGGHLLWGRQDNFDAVSNPDEWDRATARHYQRSFVHMLAVTGMASYRSDSDTYPRVANERFFLGLGSPEPANDRLYPSTFLAGFDGAGMALPPDSYGPSWPTGSAISGTLASAMIGGPASWNGVRAINESDRHEGGWPTLWNLSPFGRASEYVAGARTGYWQGPTECPWRVNAMTAAPDTLAKMLRGYLPPNLSAPAATKEERFAWVGYTTPPWPAVPVPQWNTTAYVTQVYSPSRFGSVPSGFDLRSRNFAPPSAGGGAPYLFDFTPPSSAVPRTMGMYDASYPGHPAVWEDYAAFEVPTGGRSLSSTSDVNAAMLGGFINVQDRKSFPDPSIDTSLWSNGTSSTMTLAGVSASWIGDPGEPMRGSMAASYTPLSWFSGDSVIGGDKTTYTLDANRGLYHVCSYWHDLGYALAGAITLAKAAAMDASRVGASEAPVYVGSAAAPTMPTSIQDIEVLWLRILGEYTAGDPTAPGSSLTPKPAWQLLTPGWDFTDEGRAFKKRVMRDWTVNRNIRGVAKAMADLNAAAAGSVVNPEHKLANMERVLNDMRMSFFGANPAYPNWRPYDFDGDGFANCSCYVSAAYQRSLAVPAVLPVGVAQPKYPSVTATNGVADVAPERYFSLTGYFVVEPARYYRIITRGQVWDELLQKPVSSQDYECVYAVDPDGNYNRASGGGMDDNCLIYERWVPNYYAGERSRAVR